MLAIYERLPLLKYLSKCLAAAGQKKMDYERSTVQSRLLVNLTFFLKRNFFFGSGSALLKRHLRDARDAWADRLLT